MKKQFKSSDVTLYIPCFNPDLQLLDIVVESVLTQNCLPGNIILYDDASPVLLESKWQQVDVVRRDENIGLAASRNHLVELCSTPLLAGIDADVVLEKSWLENMLKAINGEDVVGVGGCLKEFYQDSLGDRWRAVHMAQHWGDESCLNPRFLYGANTLFRVDVLRQVAYIGSLKTNYEDMSLSENLYEKNYNLYYQATALCWHYRRDSEMSILPGFWKWFHAKGHLNGEFNSAAALIERLDSVNFGIFRYRYDMDKGAGRDELLVLDSLIPWVFSALDLQFAHKVAGLNVPGVNWIRAKECLSKVQLGLLKDIISDFDGCGEWEHWHDEYFYAFDKCLEAWSWNC